MKMRSLTFLAIGVLGTACSSGKGVAAEVDASSGGQPDSQAQTATDAATDAPLQDAGDAGTVPQSCSALANIVCEAVSSCAPFFLTIFFGDMDTCASSLGANCEHFQEVGQPLDMTACSQALAAPYCHAVLSAGLDFAGVPELCSLPRGSASAGASCGADTDCESLVCVGKGLPQPDSCGSCAAAVGDGGSCDSAHVCTPDLVCNVTTCAAPAMPGSSCNKSSNLRCPGGTACVGGICQPHGSLDASCDNATGELCDEAHGLACKASACAEVVVASEGQPCGATAFADCAGGLFCHPSTSACVAESSLGGSCGDGGTSCLSPIYCNAGVCAYLPNDTCQ
jgi:hypothetical protein